MVATVIFIMFGVLSIGAVLFSFGGMIRILLLRETLSNKRRKIVMSLPMLILSILLVTSFFGIFHVVSALAVVVILIATIPVQISFIVSVFLTIRIWNGNVVIKDWNGRFKAAYITICIVAMLYLIYMVDVIIASIIGGYLIW